MINADKKEPADWNINRFKVLDGVNLPEGEFYISPGTQFYRPSNEMEDEKGFFTKATIIGYDPVKNTVTLNGPVDEATFHFPRWSNEFLKAVVELFLPFLGNETSFIHEDNSILQRQILQLFFGQSPKNITDYVISLLKVLSDPQQQLILNMKSEKNLLLPSHSDDIQSAA